MDRAVQLMCAVSSEAVVPALPIGIVAQLGYASTSNVFVILAGYVIDVQ